MEGYFRYENALKSDKNALKAECRKAEMHKNKPMIQICIATMNVVERFGKEFS